MARPSVRAWLAEQRAALVKDAPEVRVSLVRPIEVGEFVVSVAMGPAGELIVASTDVAWYRTDLSIDTEAFRRYQEAGWPTTVRVFTPGGQKTLRAPQTSTPFRLAQPLPGGRWVHVSPLAAGATAVMPNAVVCSSEGVIEHAFVIGNDVEAIKTTTDGQIWAGYGDEGVFGDSRFGEGSGLVRWTQDGERVWEFPMHTQDGRRVPWEWVSSINETEGEIWIGGRVRIGADGVVTARAVFPSRPGHSLPAAVAGPWAAGVGTATRTNLDIVLLSNEETGVLEQPIRVVMPDGGPFPQRVHVDARGDALHWLGDGAWYTADVASLSRA